MCVCVCVCVRVCTNSLWEFPHHSAHILLGDLPLPYFSLNLLCCSKVPGVHETPPPPTHTHMGGRVIDMRQNEDTHRKR